MQQTACPTPNIHFHYHLLKLCVFLCSYVGLLFFSLFVYFVAAFKLGIVLWGIFFQLNPWIFSAMIWWTHIIFYGPPSLTGWPQGTGFCVAHHGLLMSSGNWNRVVEAGTPVTDPCLETNWAFSNESMWSSLQNAAQARDPLKHALEGKKIKRPYSSSSLPSAV